jgi:hypothetical protein
VSRSRHGFVRAALLGLHPIAAGHERDRPLDDQLHDHASLDRGDGAATSFAADVEVRVVKARMRKRIALFILDGKLHKPLLPLRAPYAVGSSVMYRVRRNDCRAANLLSEGCRCAGHHKRCDDEHDGHQAARGQLRTLFCYFHHGFFHSQAHRARFVYGCPVARNSSFDWTRLCSKGTLGREEDRWRQHRTFRCRILDPLPGLIELLPEPNRRSCAVYTSQASTGGASTADLLGCHY